MKILMVNSYNYLLGGIERVVFETTKMLEEKGHEVIPFAMEDSRNRESVYNKYFVSQRNISNVKFNIDGLTTALNMIYNREARKKIGLIIDKVKPDIAHAHHVYGRLTPSVLYELKNKKVPVVMTLHDYKYVCPNYKLFVNNRICEKCKGGKYYNAVLNKCVKSSIAASTVYCVEAYLYRFLGAYDKCVNSFIVPSKFMEKKLIEHGMLKSKIHHLYNFIDINNYKSNRFKEDYVLYYGRLSSEKGLSILLEAMCQNKERKLIIVGTGELERSLKSVADIKGLNVEFKGFKSGNELKEIVRKALVVVVPSVWYENNPMVILESFALGTPVIGSDVGGIPELVIDGENGFLYKNGDHLDLAVQLKKIFCMDNEGRQKMSDNARQFAEQRFSSAVHYEKLFKRYQEAICS